MPKYNITPKPGHALNMNWTNGSTEDGQATWHRNEQTLPVDDKTPYFVAGNRGPKFLHRGTGQVIAQLTTGTQTKGLLSVASIALKPGSQSQMTFTFATDHAFQVTEGQLQLEIHGATVPLIFGDLAFLPKGTPFRYWSIVGFTKFVMWSAGSGLAEALIEQAEPWAHGVWAP
jgi:mannose-6-phosphate isomerase-like protein (cupin superfamily)